MYPEIAEIKDTGAVPQQPLLRQRFKRPTDTADYVRRQFQIMMPGKDSFDRQRLHPYDRPHESGGLGARIKGIKHTRINEIPGKQITPLRLPKADMAGRMSGRMKNRQPAAAKVKGIPVEKQPSGAALIDLIPVDIKIRRKAARARR